MFEQQKEIIRVYKKISDVLTALMSADEACEMAIAAMSEFSYKKQSFNTQIIKMMELMETKKQINAAVAEIETELRSAKKRLVKSASPQLTEKVFVMNKVEGRSLTEISERLGYSYGYVRKIAAGFADK